MGEAVIDHALPLPKNHEVSARNAPSLVEELLDGTAFRVPQNLLHWFEPHVAVGLGLLLRSIAEGIEECRSRRLRDAVVTVFASIVRRLSRADPQPVSGLEVTKIRLRKLKDGLKFDVGREFLQSLSKLARGYEEMLSDGEPGDVQVIQGDARKFASLIKQDDFRPSLVITSPAYCNAIEYWRRHRLEYQWLGLLDEKAIREISREFIGSTTVRQERLADLPENVHPEINTLTKKVEAKGHPRKANLLRKYFLDMETWISQIRESMDLDGTLYVVIGASTSYGILIDTPVILAGLAKHKGLVLKSKVSYRVINNKMQYPTRNGAGIRTEAMLCFKAEENVN
ncbi:MAG: hypothetical protein V3U52_01165 [Thermoplasmata archaeon]